MSPGMSADGGPDGGGAGGAAPRFEGPVLPRGVVVTATGKPHYHALAARLAASIKAHEPDLPVDILSDRPLDDPAFDRVHVDPNATRHTKVEALLRSRFERSLYLDSDTMAVAPFADVFDLLERFDVALAHDQFPANAYCAITWRRDMPAAFPHFNGGVMALRASPATHAFLRDWRAAIAAHGINRDQPSLRELIWLSDLRVATLPPEYNMMNFEILRAKSLDNCHMAPRIVHNPHFYQFHDQFRDSADPVADALGPSLHARMTALAAGDRTLRPGGGAVPRAGRVERGRRALASLGRTAAAWPGYARFAWGYHGRRARGFLSRALGRGV